MSRADSLAIFIATTNGPVEIQRITEEDPEIDSVVCLAGKAMPLPISYAYHNFVRQPTGVVQRDFGHGSYRADLSDTVDEGYSWQLGIYLGHAAVSAERFANDGALPARAIFATGEVNVDLDVLPVDHIATKLSALRETAERLTADGVEVDILVPRECLAAVPDGYENVRPIGSIADALEFLGLASPEISTSEPALIPCPAAADSPEGGIRKKMVIGLAVLLIVMAGGAAAVFLSSGEQWRDLASRGTVHQPDVVRTASSEGDSRARIKTKADGEQIVGSRQDNPDVRLRLVEYRAPEGSSCAAVRFGQRKPIVAERAASADETFGVSVFSRLCKIEFVAEGQSSEYLWGRFERWPVGGSEVFQNESKGPTRRRLGWQIKMPRAISRDFDMRLMIVASGRPVDGASGWLA